MDTITQSVPIKTPCKFVIREERVLKGLLKPPRMCGKLYKKALIPPEHKDSNDI